MADLLKRCGICGEVYPADQMNEDEASETGWICNDCLLDEHPEYEDFGEY